MSVIIGRVIEEQHVRRIVEMHDGKSRIAQEQQSGRPEHIGQHQEQKPREHIALMHPDGKKVHGKYHQSAQERILFLTFTVAQA